MGAGGLGQASGLGSVAGARGRGRGGRPSGGKSARSRREFSPAGNKTDSGGSSARACFSYTEADGGAVSTIGTLHFRRNWRLGRQRAGAGGAGVWRPGNAQLWRPGSARSPAGDSPGDKIDGRRRLYSTSPPPSPAV